MGKVAEIKMKETESSVEGFINGLKDEQKTQRQTASREPLCGSLKMTQQ